MAVGTPTRPLPRLAAGAGADEPDRTGVLWAFPVAPPRMLPGFVDTQVALHPWGLYDSSPMARLSNPYAAMPSLHTGWAVWCALAVIFLVRSWPIRALAACYRLATGTVVLATANHYLLDVAGGVLAVAVAIAVGMPPDRRRREPGVRPQRPAEVCEGVTSGDAGDAPGKDARLTYLTGRGVAARICVTAPSCVRFASAWLPSLVSGSRKRWSVILSL